MALQSAQPGNGGCVGVQGLFVGDRARGIAGGQGRGFDGRVAGGCGGRCARALASIDTLGQQHGRHRVRAFCGQQAAELGHIFLQREGLLPSLSGQLDRSPAFGREQHRCPCRLGCDEIAQAAQSQTEQEQRGDNTLCGVRGQGDFHLHRTPPYWATIRTRLSTERRMVIAGVNPKKTVNVPSPSTRRRWVDGL